MFLRLIPPDLICTESKTPKDTFTPVTEASFIFSVVTLSSLILSEAMALSCIFSVVTVLSLMVRPSTAPVAILEVVTEPSAKSTSLMVFSLK